MKPFSTRTLIALFSLGIVTFILGLLLTAFSGDLFDKRSARCDTFSRSLVGHHGFREFLKRSGVTTVVSRNPDLTRIQGQHPILLLEPIPEHVQVMEKSPKDKQDETHRKSLKHLLETATSKKMPVVLALPKRKVSVSYRHRSWIQYEDLLSLQKVNELLGDVYTWASAEVVRHDVLTNFKGEALGKAVPGLDLEGPVQVMKSSRTLVPLLECDQGVLIGKLSDKAFLISDPDLFNNRGLARGDHAPLMLNLVQDILGAEVLVIDESLHGHTTSQSIMKQAMTFPMVLIVIHAALFMGLLIWSVSRRFGDETPPPPPLPPGKELLIDNTSKLLLSGKDYSYAVKRYFKLNLALAANRFRLIEGTSQKEVLSRLIAITKTRGMKADLEKINRKVYFKSLAPSQALRTAKEIYAWRKELFGSQKMET